MAQEQAWLSSERIWLLHRGGFTPATRCGSADPDTGKLRIRLTTSGEELLVDEEDVEKVVRSITLRNQLSSICLLNILNQSNRYNCLHLIYLFASSLFRLIHPSLIKPRSFLSCGS